MNDQERLEFSVRFAQMELPKLREGDWLNLREDFCEFYRPVVGNLSTVIEPLPGEKRIERVKELQDKVYSMLNDLASGGSKGTRHSITIDFAVSRAQPPESRAFLAASGSMHDVFLLNLWLILSREPIERVLRCKAADCNRIFYRKRKQKYCSPRCQSRDFMRQFRKDPDNKDKESDKSHRRYKRRVEKVRKRPTKVQRRKK
jgi:hypothetical protein